MKKNILSKLYKVIIISFSLVFLAVFCYGSFASEIIEDSNSSDEITIPTSTVSQVSYLSSGDGKENDKAELTIEAYIEGEEKARKISPSDVMVVFDQSEDSSVNRETTISSIKNIIDKLPNPDDKNDSHRICLLGYGQMENTGYYTYGQEAEFNQAVPDANIWKEHNNDSPTSLPSVMRKYIKKLPSYDKCFISKSKALQVLNHPEQMSEWNSKESRADAGLVLASKFIRKRNMALDRQERESRPLIVIFASSSIPIQLVDGEKISRAESIKTAVDQIKTTCKNYGVTPNIYSIGDSDIKGFNKMMLDVAGDICNRFSLDSTSNLAKSLISLVKKEKTDPESKEIEITASKFKDPNGEEKSFAELKNQYNFDFDNAIVKRYTAKETKNGEKIWQEDPANITSQKISATDSVVSCRVSVDETAELANYNSEAEIAEAALTADTTWKITIKSSDVNVLLTVESEGIDSDIDVYYRVECKGLGIWAWIDNKSNKIVLNNKNSQYVITELVPSNYEITDILVDDESVDNAVIAPTSGSACSVTFKHKKKSQGTLGTHQVISDTIATWNDSYGWYSLAERGEN